MMSKVFMSLLILMITNTVALGAVSSKLLDRSAAVHDPAGAGTVIDGSDYYGSGNDDAFGEYGVATFTFSAADFGGTVTGLNSVTYSLTANDRPFSDGTSFSLWYTTDDFDATYSGVSYDPTVFNGFVASQFSDVTSLGSFPYDPTVAGGTVVPLASDALSATQEASLISEINSGSEFSFIIVADNAADDVTFTAFDDFFEPGGKPALSIDATSVFPEPGTFAVYACLGIGALLARRRRTAQA